MVSQVFSARRSDVLDVGQAVGGFDDDVEANVGAVAGQQLVVESDFCRRAWLGDHQRRRRPFARP
jgi:hypothetical protein